MANVNLKNLTTVYGENASINDIPTSASGIVTCGNNEILKINSLYVSNIDGTNNANITVTLNNDSTVLTHLAKEIMVPAKLTINIITSETPVYVTEGQSIRLTASASGDLSGFISYERIS